MEETKKNLADDIHDAALNSPIKVTFVNKKGKKIWTFVIGLLSVREVIAISKIAYRMQMNPTKDVNELFRLVISQESRLIDVIVIMLKSRSLLPKFVIKQIVRRYSTTDDIVRLVGMMYESTNLKSFISSIILLTGMSLLKSEEIIATEKEMAEERLKASTSSN